MITALLTLLTLGQLLPPDPPLRPRVSRAYGAERVSRLGADDYAFFEAFPASGAGAGTACPLPNWLLQSDNFASGAWTYSADSAPRTIAFTADYDGVADRLQIPATVPAAQFSRLVQGPAAGWPGGPMTCSVQIRGTSGAGTIPVYALTGFPATKTICSFNSTSYTTCSLSWTSAASGSENFYIGPSGVGGDGSFPALDVLLKNAQCNAGSVVAPYVATTTVPATSWPTGAKGEALSFARTGTATCSKLGLSRTGLHNGDLVTMVTGAPRVEPDSNGVLGLLLEGTHTGSLLRTQEIDNAIWTKTGTGVAAPTVTADFASDLFGVATAERVQFAATDASGTQASYVTNGVVAVAANPLGSVFIRGNGTSGTVDVCQQSSGSSCLPCTYNATGWEQCLAPVCIATTCNLFVGNMSLAAYNGGVARAAADVFVWGAELKPGSYLTSYIPVVSAPVTMGAETASFPVVINTTNGFSQAHSMTLESTTSFSGGMGLYQDALNRTQLYQFSTNALNSDYFSTSGGRSASNVPGLWVVGQTYRIAMSYSGAGAASTVSTYLGGVVQATSAPGLTSAWTSSAYGFAINSPFGGTDAIHSRLCADPLDARCR